MNLNLRKISTLLLLLYCLCSANAATFPEKGCSEGHIYDVQTENLNNQDMLGAAYSSWDPTNPANQIDMFGGGLPDPVYTNGGLGFNNNDSIEYNFGDGLLWYELHASPTYNGFLTLFLASDGSVPGFIGASDTVFLLPIKNETIVLFLLATLYAGLIVIRKSKKANLNS